MKTEFLNIGFGNMVSAGKIVALISPESAPVKRMIQDARDEHVLVDATCGRKTRSVLVMERGQIILSALQTETIAHRMGAFRGNELSLQEEENWGDVHED